MKKSTILGIAAGLALMASAPVMAQETTDFPYPYILTPTPGDVEDLMTINIAFTETPVYFFADNNRRVAVATLENLDTGDIYFCNEADRNTFSTYPTEYSMTFVPEDTAEEFPQAEPITAPGVYQLTVRTLCTDADDADSIIEPLFATYTIYTPCPYTLSPEPGIIATDLSVITVDFYMNRNVAFYENNRMPVATMEDVITGEVYNCYEPERLTFAESDGAVYQFVFLNEEDEVATITESSKYVLTIRGAYMEGENGETYDLKPIVADYMIGYPYTYILNPEDGETLNQIEYVYLEFPNTKNVSFMPNYYPYVGYLTNETTGSVYTCTEADRAVRATTDGVAYYLYFANEDGVYGPVMENGEYTLSIRGLVELTDMEGDDQYGDPLPAIEAKYYIDDANGIAASFAADSYTVYDLNGVQVINNGDASSLQTLKAGFYIINGKKVILRK